jgi:hypothetical protein
MLAGKFTKRVVFTPGGPAPSSDENTSAEVIPLDPTLVKTSDVTVIADSPIDDSKDNPKDDSKDDIKDETKKCMIASINRNRNGNISNLLIKVRAPRDEYSSTIQDFGSLVPIDYIFDSNRPSEYIIQLRRHASALTNIILNSRAQSLRDNLTICIRSNKTRELLGHISNGYFDNHGIHSNEEHLSREEYLFPIPLLLYGMQFFEEKELSKLVVPNIRMEQGEIFRFQVMSVKDLLEAVLNEAYGKKMKIKIEIDYEEFPSVDSKPLGVFNIFMQWALISEVES